MKKFFCSFILFFLGLQIALSATLSVSPSSSSVSESRNFTSTIYLNSGGQSVNAVQGVISFPNDKLQVVSVSKSSSIVDFWVKDPSYSNSNGTISFEGAIISGYSGSSGRVLTVTFKPKTLGSANVAFSTAQALANDGNGTDVLSGTSPATYTIIKDEKPATPATTTKPKDTIKEPVVATETPVTSVSVEVQPEIVYPQPNFFDSVKNNLSIIYLLLATLFVIVIFSKKNPVRTFENSLKNIYGGILENQENAHLSNIENEIEGYLEDIRKIKEQKMRLTAQEKALTEKIKDIKSKLDRL